MRVKAVHVLDDMTDCWFLVGKPEVKDAYMIADLGWGVKPEPEFSKSPTLLIWLQRAGGVEGAMCSFKGNIKYDLKAYGPMGYSGTTHKLAQAMRDLTFEEIPLEIDLEEMDIKIEF